VVTLKMKFECLKCCHHKTRKEGYCLNIDIIVKTTTEIATHVAHKDVNDGKPMPRTKANYDRTVAHEKKHVDSANKFAEDAGSHYRKTVRTFYSSLALCRSAGRATEKDFKKSREKWREEEEKHSGKYGGPLDDGKTPLQEAQESLDELNKLKKK
jgi:hypothetical protein